MRKEPARTVCFAALGIGAPAGAACGTLIGGAIAGISRCVLYDGRQDDGRSADGGIGEVGNISSMFWEALLSSPSSWASSSFLEIHARSEVPGSIGGSIGLAVLWAPSPSVFCSSVWLNQESRKEVGMSHVSAHTCCRLCRRSHHVLQTFRRYLVSRSHFF